jgi:uridine phosphorylase
MLYIFPTELEARRFREISPDSRVVISGVGMAATAVAVARLVQCGDIAASDVVVMAGIAGSYNDAVAMGSVVEVVRERVVELPERFRQEYAVEQYTGLRGVVSNTVCGCGAEGCGAEVENMEGAALFALAEVYGFRAVEIRAISNRVGESFECWHLEEALEALAEVLQTLK